MSRLVPCSLSVSTSAASQLMALKFLFLNSGCTSRWEAQLLYFPGGCLSRDHPLDKGVDCLYHIPEVPSQLEGEACHYLESTADCNLKPPAYNNPSGWYQSRSGKRGPWSPVVAACQVTVLSPTNHICRLSLSSLGIQR